MSETAKNIELSLPKSRSHSRTIYLQLFFFGLILPLSFAPFHFPLLAIICLAFFYTQLENHRLSSILAGLCFGLGFFTIGISWLYVSIHQYGHLNPLLSGFIMFILILYQSIFIIAVAFFYQYLSSKVPTWLKGLLFSSIWVLIEYARATFLGGFPWVLIGSGQFDGPFSALTPIIGIYGISFLTCLSATFLSYYLKIKHKPFQPKNYLPLLALLLLMLFPLAFKNKQWTKSETNPISVAIIQENLSMRDKWDDTQFWQLVLKYKTDTEALFGTDLIVMPESAIPIPSSYVKDTLINLDKDAFNKKSAILMGIPQTAPHDESLIYNSLLGLGMAKGSYLKQHLVPFGEYFPSIFNPLLDYLGVENANIQEGPQNQPLIKVHNKPIASLICYELAYPNLLRNQLPKAKFIVSISDDGWFGHSLAMYQQLQMAQVLSLLVGRYQIMANNDGLSSIIDSKGNILTNLPAFKSGILTGSVFSTSGMTPWLIYGDNPILILSLFITTIGFIFRNLASFPLVARFKRRYPYQPE